MGQAGHEVDQFIWVANAYQPRVAVLMTPIGLELDHDMWNHVYVIGGAQHGVVLAGLWQVGIKNLAPLNCFADEPANRLMCTIRDRYRKCGLHPNGDGIGVINIQEIPHFFGLEARLRPDSGTRCLSLKRHIRTLSMGDRKTRGLVFPMCLGTDDKPRISKRGESRMV